RASDCRVAGVPFKHLVNVVQMANFDFSQVLQILQRGGYENLDEAALRDRVEYAKRWLEDYAPAEMKSSLKPPLPAEAGDLSTAQKEFLARVATRLEPGMNAEAIHAMVYSAAGEAGGPRSGGGVSGLTPVSAGNEAGSETRLFPGVSRSRVRPAATA